MTKTTLEKLTEELPELMTGKKLKCYEYTYWANTTTMEIYVISEYERIAGVINGHKIADIDPVTWTVYTK